VKASETRIHFFVIALTLVLVNWRAATPDIVRVRTDVVDPVATLEVALAVGLGVALLLLLRRSGLLRRYAGMWRLQPMLLLFSAFALLSVVWSVSPPASMYKWTMFALATLVGSYFGFRLSARGLLEVLFWYGAIVLILSTAMSLIVPPAGRMFPPIDNAWRGIFWHKNHLGTLVALLSPVYLYRLADDLKRNRAIVVVDGFFFLASILIVWLSRSATGFLVLLSGSSLSAVAYVWQRARSRLRWHHYGLALALGVGALVTLAVRRETLLAMLGKDTTLTGRIPMWLSVLTDFASKRPVLGYGMGAFWNSLANRLAVQQAAGWGWPVGIGDNGWLDVLVNLGGVGLVIFMLLLMVLLCRGVARLQQGHDFGDTLHLVFFLSACLANVAFSLFFEIESGVWLILVAFLFQQSPRHQAE
jgi:exopolysaccharide production protein ExoQ